MLKDAFTRMRDEPAAPLRNNYRLTKLRVVEFNDG